MSDCCTNKIPSSDASTAPKKFPCPINGQSYSSVALKTIYQHLKKPWQVNLSAQDYYFCEDPNCEVIYYGLDGSIIRQNELRTQVGIKEQSNQAVLCYCFDVSRQDYKQDPSIKEFVVQKTKSKNCACDIRNPSVKCCLKNFKEG